MITIRDIISRADSSDTEVIVQIDTHEYVRPIVLRDGKDEAGEKVLIIDIR